MKCPVCGGEEWEYSALIFHQGQYNILICTKCGILKVEDRFCSLKSENLEERTLNDQPS
jgi:uncharacterized Zn finger protein